jgi:hypothetical protein
MVTFMGVSQSSDLLRTPAIGFRSAVTIIARSTLSTLHYKSIGYYKLQTSADTIMDIYHPLPEVGRTTTAVTSQG